MNEQTPTEIIDERIDTPESLYAEHNKLTKKIGKTVKLAVELHYENVRRDLDRGTYTGPFIYGDKAEERSIKHDIKRNSPTVAALEQRRTDNLARAKAHVQEHPEQYDQ